MTTNFPLHKIGRTAVVIAYWRMRETENPNPLFSDHLAHLFLDPETEEIARSLTRVSPSTEHLVHYRTCYLDRQLALQIENGIKQIIILGAGLDTRAIRLGTQDTAFFEIDQADVIEFKKSRLAEYGYSLNSTLLPCNYIQENWLDVLKQNGFNPEIPTYVIWEGNSMYIPEAAILSLLKAMQLHLANFVLSFDYLSRRLIERTALRKSQLLLNGFSALDAPWVTGFDAIAPLINSAGLNLLEDHLLVDLGNKYRSGSGLDARLFDDFRICSVAN